jgi:isocitrate dehydrogenase (NAD+)
MVPKVTLIPGDGIGPSIAEASRRVIEATGAKIDWDVQEGGVAAIEKFKDPLPKQTLDSIANTKVP